MPKPSSQLGSEKQPSLFAGAYNLDVRLRAVLSQAIRACPKSREQIADQMSFLLGRPVTVRMINDWTSPAHENHGIQARYLPAFCEVLGDDTPLEILLERRRELHDLLALGRCVLEAEISAQQVAALKEKFLFDHQRTER